MAKVITDDKYYKEIANIIRETVDKYGDMAPGIIGTILDFMDLSKIKPDRMVELLKLVSKYGPQAVEDNVKKTLWGYIQSKGNRTDYRHGFAGYGWNSYNFYPRYDIVPKGVVDYMFYYFALQFAVKVDLVERLEECGVKLDFSKCTRFKNAFGYSNITHLGVIDTTGAKDLTRIFANAHKTVTIDELRLRPEGGQTFEDAFIRDNTDDSLALVDIKVTGTITNDIDLHQCRNLSRASIQSFFAALSTTVKNKTAVFSFEAVSACFEETEWYDYIENRPYWDVVLE